MSAKFTPEVAQGALLRTLATLEKAEPTFRENWMLWGTSAIASDVIRPQSQIPLVSLDLDFRSRTPNATIRREMDCIKRAFPRNKIRQADLEFGLLRTNVRDRESGLTISIDLMSSDDETARESPESSYSFNAFPRQSLKSYTLNKLSCIVERLEEKDLLHLFFLASCNAQSGELIQKGLLKTPVETLKMQHEALIKSWGRATKKCVWGDLPEKVSLSKLNAWLETIYTQDDTHRS